MVLAGGGLGSLARYAASTAIMQRWGGWFPMGTFVINVSGSFAIGLLMSLLAEHWKLHPNWRLLLVVGFLGGYTTFSSFEWETYQAVKQSGHWIGLLNVVGSVVLGYLAVWLGAVIAGQR